MSKYTLKTIKQTKCYKANIDAIRAIYPDHVKDFARELMVGFNTAASVVNDESIIGVFFWSSTAQGHDPWKNLYLTIKRWKAK
jgi:hypothetical protein